MSQPAFHMFRSRLCWVSPRSFPLEFRGRSFYWPFWTPPLSPSATVRFLRPPWGPNTKWKFPASGEISFLDPLTEQNKIKYLIGLFYDLNHLLYFFSPPKYYFVSATSGTPLTPYHHPWGRFSNHHEKIRFMIKMVQGVWKNMVQCLFCKYLGNKLLDF